MAILDDLDAFLLEHRRYGELRSGVEKGARSSEIVWMDCSCGGYIARHLEAVSIDTDPKEGAW